MITNQTKGPKIFVVQSMGFSSLFINLLSA